MKKEFIAMTSPWPAQCVTAAVFIFIVIIIICITLSSTTAIIILGKEINTEETTHPPRSVFHYILKMGFLHIK